MFPSTSYWLSQIVSQTPLLVVCLAGMMASVLFLPRAKTPAVLTLIGTGLWLILSVGLTALQAYWAQVRLNGGWSEAQYRFWVAISGVGGSALHALALGLIVTAVFVGRPPRLRL